MKPQHTLRQARLLTVKRLLQLKQYRDAQKTDLEKLTDLRKDLFEKLTEQVQKMQNGKGDCLTNGENINIY